MRCAAILVVLGLAACASEKSYVEIPACADRVEVEGQAERLSSTRFELDHTFDLPLSRTLLQFKAGDRVQTFEVQSTQPDPLRLFVGAGAVVIGGLLLVSALYDVTVDGQGLFESRPFYESLWGTGVAGVGALGVFTGWHPPQQAFEFPDDVCRAGPKRDEVFER